MTIAEKERFVRWQNYQITQFSFAINLFLSFSVATLGFCLALINSAFTPPIGTGYLLRNSAYSLVGSIIFGSLATFSPTLGFSMHGNKNQEEVFGLSPKNRRVFERLVRKCFVVFVLFSIGGIGLWSILSYLCSYHGLWR